MKHNTMTRFIKELFYIHIYVKDKGFSQPNSRKIMATLFSLMCLSGFILKFCGNIHIDNTTLGILSSLACSAIGWYSWSKREIDKNPNLDAGTVPDVIWDNAKRLLNRKKNKKNEEKEICP